MLWQEVFKTLSDYARFQPCTPTTPPTPLILAGWTSSNDASKRERWKATLAWAHNNGCGHLAEGVPDKDFYFSSKPTTGSVGPMGGPMYQRWDFDRKSAPSSMQIQEGMALLSDRWVEIVGAKIAVATRPLAFTGDKARRLLVYSDASLTPPWGSWSQLAEEESKRRTFTHFRAAINQAIAPHEVDHVDFTHRDPQAR
ncbi:MAG: hypothetical protein JWL59_4354 [Chthoniobacteraceae bacterium]|nr:hypothetical protein [Chthoniobacteraceae bacterium]